MGILDQLLGEQGKRVFEDFVNRYDRGHPSEGYSDEEVVDRYRDVAHSVPPDQYAQAAQEALARLSPEERADFVRMLQERAQARGVALPRQVESDPEDLARVVTDLHQTPGRLTDLLGGGGGQAQGGELDARGDSRVPRGEGGPRGNCRDDRQTGGARLGEAVKRKSILDSVDT